MCGNCGWLNILNTQSLSTLVCSDLWKKHLEKAAGSCGGQGAMSVKQCIWTLLVPCAVEFPFRYPNRRTSSMRNCFATQGFLRELCILVLVVRRRAFRTSTLSRASFAWNQEDTLLVESDLCSFCCYDFCFKTRDLFATSAEALLFFLGMSPSRTGCEIEPFSLFTENCDKALHALCMSSVFGPFHRGVTLLGQLEIYLGVQTKLEVRIEGVQCATTSLSPFLFCSGSKGSHKLPVYVHLNNTANPSGHVARSFVNLGGDESTMCLGRKRRRASSKGSKWL